MKQPKDILEDWRKQNGKSQEEMAILLGMKTQQNYGDIATGRKKKIDLDIAQRFYDLTGLSLITTDSRETINKEGPSIQSVKTMLAQAIEYLDLIQKKTGINSNEPGSTSESSPDLKKDNRKDVVVVPLSDKKQPRGGTVKKGRQKGTAADSRK